MTQALHSAFDNLIAGLDRQHTDITAKIDALVSSHDHGGKAAFDQREAALRASVAGLMPTLDALKQVAGALADKPVDVPAPAAASPAAVEPLKAEAPVSPAIEPAVAAARRTTRTSVPEGE